MIHGKFLVSTNSFNPELVIFYPFKNSILVFLGDELFNRICLNLKVRRIARKNPVKSNVYRSSNVELLWGENGVVEHTDNKIK